MTPLFVEFIGPPGAGKTTVANEVARILVSRGYRAARHPRLDGGTGDRLWHSLRFFGFRIANWRLWLLGVRYAWSVRPFRFSRWRHIRFMLFRAYYQREMKRSDYQVVVFCQSYVQTAWSTTVPGDGFEETRLEHLFAQLYREVEGSQAFVLLDIDPATAARRVVNRTGGRSRFDALPVEEVERSLASHGERFRTLAECACRSTAAPIRYLDGKRPVSETAEQVADFIESVFRESENSGATLGEHSHSLPRTTSDPLAELQA